MRLKRLRLSGFKSFCDDTEFEFGGQGVNVVLGPNGCGKSNVVDAIRWALGEQSPKQLRGGAMGDVIFGGSTDRKPIGRCEVTLTFENHDGDVPEKYRDFSEVAVTRRLYRTGESEYLINGMTCRLMDIRDLVMDTGVAGHAYAIVEQGRVEQFITASPAERRVFVEEAAGVVRYRTRRAAAEKRLEQTDQNLLRVTDLLRELHRQEEALRGQVEQAETYAALRDEVGALAGALARARHRRAEAEVRRLEGQRSAVAGEHEAQEQAIQLLEVQWERLQNDQALLESQLKRTRAAFYDKQRQGAQVESRLALERQNRDHTGQWIRDLETRGEEFRNRREALTAERGEVAETLAAGEREREALEQAIGEAERDFADREAAANAVTERLQSLQEQLLECHTTLTGHTNQQRFLGERIEEWRRRESALDAQFRAGETERRQAEASRGELADRAGALAREAAAADARNETLGGEIAAQAETLEAARRALAEAREAETEARSRLNALAEVDAAHEGLEESVRKLLAWAEAEPGRAGRLGIVGPLAEHVRVPEAALAWAGGVLAPLLDLVVVREAAAIPELEAAIAAEGMGRVRLAPLDALGNGAADAPDDSLAAQVRLEGELAPLGPALFGGIRRLPDGRAAYPRPEGAPCTEWLAADGRFHLDHRGAVALGEAAAPELAVLRRRNDLAALREQVAAQAERLGALGEEAERAGARHADLIAEREALQQTRQGLALERRTLEQQREHVEADVQRLTRAQAALQAEREQTARDLARAREQLAALEAESREAQERREALERDAATVRQESQAAREAAAAVGERLTERKVALGQATSRGEHLRGRQETIAGELETLAGRIGETEAEIARQQDALARHGEAIEAATAELARLQEAQAAEQQAVNELQRRFETGDQQRVGLAGRLKSAQGERDRSQAALHDLDKALAVEQLRMEQAGAQLGEAPPSLPDLAGLDEGELERRWKAGSGRLERMGSVNLAAPEEHGAVRERLTTLEEQRSDLEAASEDLRESIRRMNHESRRRFKDAFEQVNATFQRVFPEVFGGGEARLVLTDSEDLLLAGVDIVAQPPGKKLQNLSLLSGGEKALTAIALIFSFFLIKPSPFCLLDEVDAPLDDANVSRFNRLVRSMTDRTQFIIITHNRRTMESGNQLFGVTMEEAGVSKVVSVQLADQPAFSGG